MILTFFFSFVQSIIPRCLASNEINEIPSSYDLVQYHLIINSGSHSPKKTFLKREQRGFWRCDSPNSHYVKTNAFPLSTPRIIHSIIDKRYSEYPPNCGLNDPTVEGLNQLYNLGSNYRKKLISSFPSLFQNIKQNIQIRATNEENSFKNSISFLSGLLNNEKIDDLNIITGTKNREIIVVNEKYCNDINDLIYDFENSKEYQRIISKAQNVLSEIFDFLYPKENSKKLSKKQIINACEFILSMYCNEQILDLNITDNLIEKVENYYSLLNFGHFFSKSKSKIGVAASPLVREIVRTINNSIENKNQVKFSLLSADDSSISAILALIDNERSFLHLASHLSFAVLKKNGSYFLQISLNGKPLTPPFSKETVFSYSEFINYVNNFTGFCNELP